MHPPTSKLLVGASLLALFGCDSRSYTSLPGPKPEECAQSAAYDLDAMTADLAYLASPELDGRAPGSEGDVAARTFVEERFACLGLEPLGEGYQQAFTDSDENETANVLARIPGEGRAGESIVLSAHIDHFGGGWLGANDNASGVTALLAVAQSLVEAGEVLDRSIVFAVFGAEESGFEGSEYLVRHPPDDLNQVVYNLNMDMVGSYSESTVVYALGTFAGTPGRRVVTDRAKGHPAIEVAYGDGSDESDNEAFCTDGVPYVFLWTEDDACYHRRCDTSSRIDYEALTEVEALAGETVLDLANSEADLAGDVDRGVDRCF